MAWRDYVAGGAAGLSALVVQPLDVLKTRREAPSNFVGATPRYQRPVQIASIIVREEGVLALWRGAAATVLYGFPSAALYFGTVSQLTAAAKRHNGNNQVTRVQNLAAGATARFIATTCTAPAILMKTRFESADLHRIFPAHVTTLRAALLHTWRTQGIRGLYSGFGATLARDVPWASIQFAAYTATFEALEAAQKQSPALSAVPTALLHSLAGGAGGIIASVLTHPFDVVKTSVQLQGGSSLAVVRGLAAQGWRAFYRGLGARVVHRMLLPAISWPMFQAAHGFISGAR